MEILTVIVQWLHVAFAITWAGGSALLELLVRPLTEQLPAVTERAVGRKLARIVVPYFATAGSGTIVTGFLRGTLFGPVKGAAELATPYGATWLLALLLAAGLAVLGGVGIGRTMERYYATDAFWPPSLARSTDADRGTDAARHRRRLVSYGRLQLAGFAVILVGMLLMSEVFS